MRQSPKTDPTGLDRAPTDHGKTYVRQVYAPIFSELRLQFLVFRDELPQRHVGNAQLTPVEMDSGLSVNAPSTSYALHHLIESARVPVLPLRLRPTPTGFG